MTEETIFENSQPVVPDTPLTSPLLPTEVADLVGEGKKYKSVDEALRSVPHAQKHINTLEQELSQLKEELTKRKTTEELLDEVKSGFLKGETTPSVGYDQDKILETVSKVLEAKEAQKTASLNVNQVISAFNAKFGEQGPDMYKRLAAESGLTIANLNNLAANSPQAVLKLAGLTEKASIPGKIQSSINTESLPSGQQGVLSSRVQGRTTKDMVSAWKTAGEQVQKTLG